MTITTSTAPLSEMLAALDMAPDTRLSWLILRDGQPNRSGVGSVADLTARQWPVDADCYVGLNPLSAPVATGSRGKADDIAQLSTLVLDLDERGPHKPEGLDAQDVPAVIDDMSALLGTRPVAVIGSGHGWQPIWAVDDEITEATSAQVAHRQATWRRFTALGVRVAALRGGTVDDLSDTARVWRVPGTVNHKADPVPVTFTHDTGYAIGYRDLVAALDAAGVDDPGDPKSRDGDWTPPEEWPVMPEASAPWVADMTATFAGLERPRERHYTHLAKCVQLMAAVRLGAVCNGDAVVLAEILKDRLTAWRKDGKVRPGEHGQNLRAAVVLVGRKTDEECRAELAQWPGSWMPQESEPVVGDGAVGDAPPPPDDGILASRIDWRTAFNREHTETDWIVPGLVEAGRAVALYSPAKAGKSLFLLWLAARVALGQDIFGQPVKARTVLYVDLENTQGDVLDRMEHMGFDADTEALAERLHYLSLPMMRRLDTPEGGRQITEAALAVGADLVVIDTAARTITTAEKDADTWHNWYSNTGFPLKHHGIAVIRLDHSGKDEKKGQRGSSAKNSDVDLVVRLTATQDGAGDAVFLKAEESRQAHYLTRAKLRRGRDDCGFLTHDVESLEWPAGSIDPGVQAVMDQLDGLDVPVTAGRGTVLAALKAAGLKYPKRVVEQAIRVRKEATR